MDALIEHPPPDARSAAAAMNDAEELASHAVLNTIELRLQILSYLPRQDFASLALVNYSWYITSREVRFRDHPTRLSTVMEFNQRVFKDISRAIQSLCVSHDDFTDLSNYRQYGEHGIHMAYHFTRLLTLDVSVLRRSPGSCATEATLWQMVPAEKLKSLSFKYIMTPTEGPFSPGCPFREFLTRCTGLQHLRLASGFGYMDTALIIRQLPHLQHLYVEFSVRSRNSMWQMEIDAFATLLFRHGANLHSLRLFEEEPHSEVSDWIVLPDAQLKLEMLELGNFGLAFTAATLRRLSPQHLTSLKFPICLDCSGSGVLSNGFESMGLKRELKTFVNLRKFHLQITSHNRQDLVLRPCILFDLAEAYPLLEHIEITREGSLRAIDISMFDDAKPVFEKIAGRLPYLRYFEIEDDEIGQAWTDED